MISMWCDSVLCSGWGGGPLHSHLGIREGFLEQETSDIRFKGTRAVHQAKTEKRVLGREDRGVQRPERND